MTPETPNAISFSFSITKLLFDVMGSILFVTTFTCTIALTFNLFVVELSDAFSFEIFVAVFDLYIVLGLTFAYFYLSERITTDLTGIGYIFYNAAWYELKSKQQKLFVLPIERAHKKVRLTGLGLFDCSLPVFASVCILSTGVGRGF